MIRIERRRVVAKATRRLKREHWIFCLEIPLFTILFKPTNTCVKHYSQEEYLSLKNKCCKRNQRNKAAKYYDKYIERQAAYDAKNKSLIARKRSLYYQVNRAKILERMKEKKISSE